MTPEETEVRFEALARKYGRVLAPCEGCGHVQHPDGRCYWTDGKRTCSHGFLAQLLRAIGNR